MALRRYMNYGCIALLLPATALADPYIQHLDSYPSPLQKREEFLLEAPQNSFDYEVQKLGGHVSEKFIPAEEKEYAGHYNTYTSKDIPVRKKLDSDNLAPAQLDLLVIARSAKTADEAYDAGKDLPSVIRAYTAGVVAFEYKDMKTAALRFAEAQNSAELPAYGLMAAFMLGRTQVQLQEGDKARGSFQSVREAVKAGAPDPFGLAVASYGEEARIALDEAGGVLGESGFDPERPGRLQKFHDAIKLYAMQAATGSRSGFDSLHIMAKNIKNVPEDFTLLMKDELCRRLFLAYIRGYGMINYRAPHGAWYYYRYMHEYMGGIEKRAEFIARLLPLFPAEDKDIADQLAAAAYEIGNFDLARRYLSQKDSAYSGWIEAKLKLQSARAENKRTGEITYDFLKKQEVLGLYNIAFRQSQTDVSIDLDNEMLAHESGILELAESNLSEAFERLVPLQVDDAEYMATRILTVVEFKAYVDEHVPESAAIFPKYPPGTPQKEIRNKSRTVFRAQALRTLLAERLMRLGRLHEALPYFAKWQRDIAEPYVKWIDKADASENSIDKAAALFQAAKLMRASGSHFMGIDLAYLRFADATQSFAFMGRLERQRLQDSRVETLLPPSYRMIATTQAIQAADLLPARSQAFAAVLCHATNWIRPISEDQGQNLYQRYVRQGAMVP